MAMPSLFKRKDKAPTTDAAPVEAVRTRARRRLIGAVVLLGIGIIAFPLLFETAPRPIPVDLPIEIPRKDQVGPLAMPASEPAGRSVTAKVETPIVTEPAPASAAAPAPDKAVEKAADKPVETAAVTPAPTPDGARAKALLEGKSVQNKPADSKPAAPANGGWVVQIGAFAEDRTVRDVRAKADKIGLATFTQIVAVEAGERTRVRVGPFEGRDDADAAAAKLKKAGLPASVLKL